MNTPRDIGSFPEDAYRNDFNEAVRESLAALDGSESAAVKLLTGLTDRQLEKLGGF